MNRIALAALPVALVLGHQITEAAPGATAPYNEAVKIVDGKRVVDVAPFPAHMQHAVRAFKKPEEYPYEVSVSSIETPEGLMDCMGTLWFHPKACSPSNFGKGLRDRTWVVKMKGQWFTCASFTSAKTCVPLISDGNLRPIPSFRE